MLNSHWILRDGTTSPRPVSDAHFEHASVVSAKLLYCQITQSILYLLVTFCILVLCILWGGTRKL